MGVDFINCREVLNAFPQLAGEPSSQCLELIFGREVAKQSLRLSWRGFTLPQKAVSVSIRQFTFEWKKEMLIPATKL